MRACLDFCWDGFKSMLESKISLGYVWLPPKSMFESKKSFWKLSFGEARLRILLETSLQS